MTRFFSPALLVVLSACATLRGSSSIPEQPPTPIQTVSEEGTRKSWTFTPDFTEHQYRLTSTTIVRLESDTATRQDTITTSLSFSLTTTNEPQSQIITGELKQRSTTVRSRAGNTTSAQTTAIRFSGRRQQNQLTLQPQSRSPSTTVPCHDSAAAQLSGLYIQLPRIPPSITMGDTWSDSVTFQACLGTIATEVHLTQHYRAVGEVVLGNQRAVLLQRTDSTSVKGEGSQGEHRVAVEKHGTGSTRLYIHPLTGIAMGADGQQTVSTSITASGLLQRFSQLISETLRLLP